MAKANKNKNFYAVRVGRDGKAIYNSWDEAKSKVDGFPKAQHKGFALRAEAERWVNEPIPMALPALSSSSSFASPPRSASSHGGGGKRKHEVISLISSDEPRPDDMPFTSLKRSRPVKSGAAAAPTPSTSKQYPLSSSQGSRSSASRTPIVIDGSDELEPAEDMLQPAFYASPFFPPPTNRKPPSPRPQLKSLPKNDPLPLNTVTPVPSTSAGLGVGASGGGGGGEDIKPEPKVELSEEQMKLLNLAKKGKSVFFTGSAGTGKSVLLREMIRELRAQHPPHNVHVTGSTGMAAVSIGGTTLHSFSALGLAKEKQEVLLAKLQSPKGKKGRERWYGAKVLIIDEISMIDCRFFDKLDFVARHIRGQLKQPFGGLQIIATGDFFQLPPVAQGNVAPPYCFKAMCFRNLFKEIHVLRKVFRQKDQSFVNLLNKMRQGVVDHAALKVFESLDRPLVFTDGIEATHLMATKMEVSSINETQLHKLEGSVKEFQAVDKAPMSKRGFRIPMDEARQKLDRNTIAEYTLKLKPKAQVMLIKNLPDFGLVNGSRGMVLGFYSVNELVNLAREGEHVDIAFDPRDQDRGKKDKKELAAAKYFEDERAYEEHCAEMYEASLQAQEGAAQGWMTAGQAHLNGDVEMSGQHSGEQVPLPPAEPQKPIMVDDGPDATRWPVVKFARGVTLMVPPMAFEVQNGDGEVEAERQAVPLILAWALSIHKSQGQTIERLKVDLGSIFEKGQAYVAVSRATSLETLEVRNFRPKCVMSAPEVAQFYEEHT